MEILNEKIKEVSLKREDAINEVKSNLKKYALLKLYPETIEERVSSLSSSLIVVNADKNTRKDIDYILNALAKEEDDLEFINRYDYLLSCLCKESNEYIIRIYFDHEKIEAIKDENTNIFYYLKDTYEILACLDETIDYSIEDYTIYSNHIASTKKNEAWRVKKLALDYLNGSRDGLLVEKVNETLELLPEEEKKYVEGYIYNKIGHYTSYEYRIVLRGLLLFAYYFELIEFSREELEVALKKTGSGWKKVLKNVK